MLILLQSERVIYAEAPDEGLHKFIQKHRLSLTPEEKRYLKEWKKNIYTLKDPYNVLMVIYPNESADIYKIQVGNGDARVMIELSDCMSQSSQIESLQTQSESRQIEVTMEEKVSHTVRSSSGSGERSVAGAGLGAAVMSGIYFGLAANPVTGPVVCAATVGAMLGVGAAEVTRNNTPERTFEQTRTYTLKCPVEKIEQLPEIIEKITGPNTNIALQ